MRQRETERLKDTFTVYVKFLLPCSENLLKHTIDPTLITLSVSLAVSGSVSLTLEVMRIGPENQVSHT